MNAIKFHINYELAGRLVTFNTASTICAAEDLQAASRGLVEDMTADTRIKRASRMVEGAWPIKVIVTTYYI